MIAWLFKNWKLFLDIIIVVGGIILLTIFDPFGIFSNRSLKNTANILSSVKGIGELVTAEYYGEVISSLQGTQIYDLEVDTLSSEFQNCFVDLKYLLVNTVLNKLDDNPRLRRRDKKDLLQNVISSQLKNIKSDYDPQNVYSHLVTFIGYNNIKSDASLFYDTDKKKLEKDADERVCEFLLNEIYLIVENKEASQLTIGNKDISDYIYAVPNYFTGVVDFHYQLNREQIQKKNHDIVFIGRGWVKAGYRFDKLDKSNFYYDSDNKIIRFYGLSPVILDNDINPWFIPEKRIKGYELVDFYKRATFEEAIAVKLKCKQELLEQAFKADILAQAQINGEESLRNFFVLLTDEPGLKVEFHELPYQKELNLIAADTLITVNEALLIDSIIQLQSRKINVSISPDKEYFQEQLIIFMNQLNDLWFVEKGTKFNIFMTDAAKILNHKLFVTGADYDSVIKLRKPVMLGVNNKNEWYLSAAFPDSNKYKSPYPEFIAEFNEMLNVLESEVGKVDGLRGDTLKLDFVKMKNSKIDTVSFHIKKVSSELIADTVSYYNITHKNIKREFKFTDLKYPVLKIPVTSYDTLKISDTVKVASLIDAFIRKTDILTENHLGDSLRKDDLAAIKEYESQKIIYEIKARPVKRLTSGIKRIFN